MPRPGHGFVRALLAIAPVLFERGGRGPNISLGLLLLAILVSGHRITRRDNRRCCVYCHCCRAGPNNTEKGKNRKQISLAFIVGISIAWHCRNSRISGKLAAVARPLAQRHQQRKEPAGQMDHRRERRLETGDAGLSGSTPIIWRDHIFLNVARGRQFVSLGASITRRARGLWKKPLGGGNVKMRKQNMSSPSPVTDGRASTS